MDATSNIDTNLPIETEWPVDYGILRNYPPYFDIITASQRFSLVSSLYGPGNILCWFFLILSVLVSWRWNPAHAKHDTITADFITVLCMPVVSVGHFIHLVWSCRTQDVAGLKAILTADYLAAIEMVAAIEAPLTVCEDFIACASILCFFAWRRGHKRRLLLVGGVGVLCWVVELLLLVDWVPYASATFIRPFYFHHLPLFFCLFLSQVLTFACYFLEILLRGAVMAVGARDTESGKKSRGWFAPGRYSKWMFGSSPLVACLGAMWIKYGWVYRASLVMNSVRFLPRSSMGFAELDQMFAAVGGLMALAFSLQDARRERTRERRKSGELRKATAQARWGR
ncbi:hypothetical protein QBC34DRAFT_108724 [Podospora aff. communis PSN243]|uniref:Uncharacterized protein n=1 Tax=Podospora aff. communis PSN243 TaxID=3040156 RepID=A0AAV9H6N1_9PEZI|nr:hypothetical protein QBC34DRAFT_108724 [Podospora aff. communis PSN243]